MQKKKYIYFQDNGLWIGNWEEFPDYMTQGETLEELQENLMDIYKDLTNGTSHMFTMLENLMLHETKKFD